MLTSMAFFIAFFSENRITIKPKIVDDQEMEEFYDFSFLDGHKISDHMEITVNTTKSKLLAFQSKYAIALLQGIDNSKMVIGIIGFDLYYHCHIRPKNTLELYKVSRFRNEPKKDKYENETMVLTKNSKK